MVRSLISSFDRSWALKAVVNPSATSALTVREAAGLATVAVVAAEQLYSVVAGARVTADALGLQVALLYVEASRLG